MNQIATPYNWLAANSISAANEPAILGVGSSLNWFDFHRYVQQVATKLTECGIKNGDFVMFSLPQKLVLPFVFAAFKLGLTFSNAPMSTAKDHRGKFNWLVTWGHAEALDDKHILVNNDWLEAAYSVENYVATSSYANEDSLAMINFTSGTTGIAKGAPFSISQLIIRCTNRISEEIPNQITFSLFGLTGSVGLNRAIQNVKRQKPTFVYESVSSVAEQLQLIQKYRPGVLRGSPVQILSLFREAQTQRIKLDFLVRVYSGGGMFGPGLQRIVSQNTKAEIVVNYAGTECGGIAAKTNSDPKFRDQNYMGPVRHDAQVRVIDENGEVVANGTIGRIETRTQEMITGYFENPIETARSFRDGWFLPGDTGYLTDKNELYLVGRTSEMINAGGVKISPVEIDLVVAQVAGVVDCCAFAIVNEFGMTEIGIAVVAESNALEPAAVMTKIKESRVSGGVKLRLLRIDLIPRNEMGKPLRAQLTKKFQNANN